MLGRDQAKKLLDYMIESLFNHFQLYMACARVKQVETMKHITMQVLQPQLTEDLETDCR